MKIICSVLTIISIAISQAVAADHPGIVDPLSTTSLYLTSKTNETTLATATGFIVAHKGKYYLVTNRHVVSGRDSERDQVIHPSGSVPNQLMIWHHGKRLGTRVARIESLYLTNGAPRWIEHSLGSKVDVVALLIQKNDPDMELYPFDLNLADTDMAVEVAMPVSIIGFPLGLTGPENFPIWKTGHLASDPDIDFEAKPRFLIDATTRGGMSGSPVVLRVYGSHLSHSGDEIVTPGTFTKFLGVYSAQNYGMEIGQVWRPSVIRDILNRAEGK